MKKTLYLYIITPVTISLTLLILIFSSSCQQKAEQPESFAFDSWATLNEVASKGFDNLIEVYKPVGGSFIIQDLKDDSEVIMKTRHVLIEGVGNFKVRVIGENHDVSSDKKTCPLTFEFDNVVPAVSFTPFGQVSNVWESSEIRNFMNNKLFDMLPENLKPYIKTVSKETCVGGGSSEVKAFDEKLFSASASEIGIAGKNNLNEGETYEFYKKYPWDVHSKKDPRIKGKNNYWLRSPLKENSINAWFVQYDDDNEMYSKLYFDDVAHTFGAVPCFCI